MAKSRSSAVTTATDKDEHVVIKYLKSIRAELRKVIWPTREETKNLTMIIVAVTVAMATFLGLLDLIFQEVAAGIIRNNFLWVGLAVILFLSGAAAFYFNGQEE